MSSAAPAVDELFQPPTDAKAETLGVTFFDLARFAEWAGSDDDRRIAGFLQGFYVLSHEQLQPKKVRIVKFIGDAGLGVFPPESADGAVGALADLAVAVRRFAKEVGLDTWLNIKVHVGPVLSGSFGPPGQARFDIIGKTVNIAARLGRRGLVLSQPAYDCLGPDVRQRFNKYETLVTYSYRFD